MGISAHPKQERAMNDRELLELAAKAAGIPKEVVGAKPGSYWIARTRSTHLHWNPLTDDGDALRLAVKLRIEVDYYLADVQASADNTDPVFELFSENQDVLSATRRAIVRAAAEIGRSMP